jgi:hypothetical protein
MGNNPRTKTGSGAVAPPVFAGYCRRVRGFESFIYQHVRRLSHQLPFWMSRLGAGSHGNMRAELAPTRRREGNQGLVRGMKMGLPTACPKGVEPSQGCLPKPQAVV